MREYLGPTPNEGEKGGAVNLQVKQPRKSAMIASKSRWRTRLIRKLMTKKAPMASLHAGFLEKPLDALTRD